VRVPTITITVDETAEYDVLNSDACQRHYNAQARANLFRRLSNVITDQPGEHTIKLKITRTRKANKYTYTASAVLTIEGGKE
jgi:hypothetical protein